MKWSLSSDNHAKGKLNEGPRIGPEDDALQRYRLGHFSEAMGSFISLFAQGRGDLGCREHSWYGVAAML
jgi:hypothetical protein